MRILILFIISFSLSAYCEANQPVDCPSIVHCRIPTNPGINKFDEDGKKHGYWVESSDKYVIMTNYNHGNEDGLYQCFKKMNDGNYYLETLGEHKDGKFATGQRIEFYPNGMVSGICEKFAPISEAFKKDANNFYFDPDVDNMGQFFSVEYDEDGQKISEGWYVFFEDDPITDVIKVGIWTIYSPSGEKTYENYTKAWEDYKRERDEFYRLHPELLE